MHVCNYSILSRKRERRLTFLNPTSKTIYQSNHVIWKIMVVMYVSAITPSVNFYATWEAVELCIKTNLHSAGQKLSSRLYEYMFKKRGTEFMSFQILRGSKLYIPHTLLSSSSVQMMCKATVIYSKERSCQTKVII